MTVPSGSVIVRAPAKINLSLLVGPPGVDGYHPLSTVFMPVDLTDRLEFALRATPDVGAGEPRFRVECDGIPSEANLVSKALRAVEALTGWRFSGSVSVAKGIPAGAGLGGGSSDAALTLTTAAGLVADLGGPSLDEGALRTAARNLGADVPFFLAPLTSLAAGVGDALEPLPLPHLPLVLVLPQEELSTADVYRAFDGDGLAEDHEMFEARRRENEGAWRGLSRQWTEGRENAEIVRGVAALLANDLERASFALMPDLARTKRALAGGGVFGSLMSGSGPTLFAVCDSWDAAERTAERTRREGHEAFSTWGGARALPGA